MGYMPFDYKLQNWAGRNHWYWRIGDQTRQTGGLGAGRQSDRQISETAARKAAFRRAAVDRRGCRQSPRSAGSGSLKPNAACLSYGTTATINTTHEKYHEIIPLSALPAAVPGLYNLELQIYRGYWMVSWFKQEFGLFERGLAEREGIEAEVLLDKLNSAPPGSQGLVLQPIGRLDCATRA